MEESNTLSGVILTPYNFNQFHDYMKNQCMDLPRDLTIAIDGITPARAKAPSTLDTIMDLSTGLSTNRLKFAETDLGNRAYNDACNIYKKEMKETEAALGKILKLTLQLISPQSESMMKAYGDFDKAKEDAGAFWRLIKNSHLTTSSRETFNALHRLVNCKQNGENYLSYLATFNKMSLEFQESVNDFDKLSSTQLMDVLKKVLIMTGVDKENFKQVIDNILDSAETKSFADVQRRMTQYYRNSLDNEVGLGNATGYAATNKSPNRATMKSPDIVCVCSDCNEKFPYQLSARTGKIFQRCHGCQRRHNNVTKDIDRNRMEKATKNLSLSELLSLQENQKKATVAAIESQLASKKIPLRVGSVTPKKTAAVTTASKKSSSDVYESQSRQDDEDLEEEFGLVSGGESS